MIFQSIPARLASFCEHYRLKSGLGSSQTIAKNFVAAAAQERSPTTTFTFMQQPAQRQPPLLANDIIPFKIY